MKVVKGKDAYIEFYKEGEYRSFACADTVDIIIDTEMMETKTVGDGNWAHPKPRKHSYSIQLSGLAGYDTDEVTHKDLREYQIQEVAIELRIIFNNNEGGIDDMIKGIAFVQNYNLSSPIDFVGCTFSLAGVGKPEFGLPPTCSALITDASVESIAEMRRVTVNEVVNGPVPRFDYRYITLMGGIITGTSFTNTWDFLPYEGGTMFISPVCENGLAGPEYELPIVDETPAAPQIFEIAVDSPSGDRTITVLRSISATSFDWIYSTDVGGASGSSSTPSWSVSDLGIGSITVTPKNAGGEPGTPVVLVMSIGQSGSCDAKILATTTSDNGTVRSVTITDFNIAFVKLGWKFYPDDPLDLTNYSGTVVSSVITGLPIKPGTLSIKPYCSSSAFGETYYSIIP